MSEQYADPNCLPPRYDEEDTSSTTHRELMGWYSYGLAAEVFAVCGVGSFLPITLEQLAREHGVLRSDGVTPCVQKAGEKGASQALRLLRRAADSDSGQCVVRPFGKDIATSSFAMYTFSVAVLVQALVLISFSAVADHGTYRKKLLLAFGFVGAASSAMFILVGPNVYMLGSLLVIIGVPCLGSSFVLLNSFLPLLSRYHPSVTGLTQRKGGNEDGYPLDDYSVQAGSSFSSAQFHQRAKGLSAPSPELQFSTKVSSKGVGVGYAAAVLVQIISIGILFGLSKFSFSSASIPLRIVLFLVGLWWAAFTIPTALWLRDRPGPPLKSANPESGRLRRVLAYISFAWASVYKTIKVAVKLRQVVIFLIAWFLLSDAIATVSGTAILFARTELHMSTVETAILSITATSSGIAGAFFWPIIARKLKLQTNHTIIACILFMEVIPLYGLTGYLPFVKHWGVGGLQKAWEIYPLGFVHGFVMGGLSSYCRSFFGQLIPPGSEAAFYALYAITDKGSSAIGPAIVGRIVDILGTIRPAFGFLAILIACPLPLIWMVDVEKGRDDALRMAGVDAPTERRSNWGHGSGGEDREDAEALLGSSHED